MLEGSVDYWLEEDTIAKIWECSEHRQSDNHTGFKQIPALTTCI